MFNPYGAIAAYDGIATAARTYSDARLKERTTVKASAALEFAAQFQQAHPGAASELSLLAGILQEGTNVAAMALRLRRVDSAKVEVFVAATLDFTPEGQSQPSDIVESFLAKCWDQAVKLGHGYIGPEHILLAIADSQKGKSTLESLQADANSLKETALYLINERS